jgi:hypothetical protein
VELTKVWRMSREEWQQVLSLATDSQVQFDAEGLAGLVLPDLALYVGFLWQDDAVTLYAPLGQVTHADLFAEMLTANGFWRQTLGATLSIYDTDQALLAIPVPEGEAWRVKQLYVQFLGTAS